MELIQNNPYRILGLFVGASAREQDRQLRRLKLYIEADQEPEEDASFPSLGKLYRTLEKVNDAASQLNLDSDKMNAALFWFYNGNSITDEPAFDAIKDADLDQVINIWTKLISNGVVTQRNASAFNNLGTIYLSGILDGTNSNVSLFEKGISLKLKFLDSIFIKEFKAIATDETFKITNTQIQLLFLNLVQTEIEKSKKITSNQFLEIITKQEFSAKEDFLKDFVQKPIEQIEKKIDDTKIKRKANKANAVNLGRALFEQTSENLKQLKSVLGNSNLKFSSISDKVSDEILQCGIDYFSHYKDSNTDPGTLSMELFHLAKTLAVGNIAKQRCQENSDNLQDWISDKPEREKQAKILGDFTSLKNLIDEFEKLVATVENGKYLLSRARPYLNNVKNVLGRTDELYLGLCSRIASDAQAMCVSEINHLQDLFKNTYDNATKESVIYVLKQRVNEAWYVTLSIGAMDLNQDFRARFNQNKNSLSSLKAQLERLDSTGRSGGSSSGGSSSGCYIATMAYGDYDHPQVLILRKFRDEVLDKSAFGKWFIKTYYFYSPKLVEKLKNKQRINSIIRTILNLIIKIIK